MKDLDPIDPDIGLILRRPEVTSIPIILWEGLRGRVL